eukprot:s1642_g7.t2
MASRAVPSAFGLFDRNTGDIESIQKLINHANDVAAMDLKQVSKGAAEVRKIRAQLDKDFSKIRLVAAVQLLLGGIYSIPTPTTALGPACKAYSKARTKLLVGDPMTNQKAVSQECLKAQGMTFAMIGIGEKGQGCTDTCALSPDDQDAVCDRSGCHGKLRTKKDLEDILGGPEWRKRKQELLEACGRWPYELKIFPPAGVDEDMEEDVETTEECMGEGPLIATFLAAQNEQELAQRWCSSSRHRQTAFLRFL